ncbi:MAG: ABC transporter substrate-binding protein [Trueperaceae bacterium]|nr:ABC transporter substrate-binding protein [Trueperaceae bacterium]
MKYIRTALLSLALIPLVVANVSAQDDMDARMATAEQLIDEQFTPSAISREEQLEEMRWFIEASQPYRGMEITSAAENIRTHVYEAEVLAPAFEALTGIRVTHDIIGEGDVIERLQTQINSGEVIYDIYVNDADLIGTHLRYDTAVNLTDYMMNEGAAVTNPTLDIDDWLNPEFGQDYDGNQLQLPDQQFANLYWFRYDWFTDEDIKAQFQEIYGYELGVPVNWAAYDDIANFFTNEVNGDGTIDGVQVYGHMDYGRRDVSLGWRFTDAWLSIAGVGDTGLPNGLPVDEWGIRVEDCHPRGSDVRRGGAVNGPAANYALDTYIRWLNDYAPPEARSLTWSEAGPVPSQGQIAQRVFQYITWLSNPSFNDPESPVTDDEGNVLWRVAPTPHGRYWDEGMKIGYQDAGSWTILQSVEGDRRAAAWLWAQFASSKTVSLAKFLEGKTPVRRSTVFSDYLTEREGDFGGLITFYRSPVENLWTDTGPNVPDYPRLSQLWWQNIANAITGDVTVQEALDTLAEEQDRIMSRLERAGMEECAPIMNEPRDASYWLEQPGAPKAERFAQTPITVTYEALLEQWRGEE